MIAQARLTSQKLLSVPGPDTGIFLFLPLFSAFCNLSVLFCVLYSEAVSGTGTVPCVIVFSLRSVPATPLFYYTGKGALLYQGIWFISMKHLMKKHLLPLTLVLCLLVLPFAGCSGGMNNGPKGEATGDRDVSDPSTAPGEYADSSAGDTPKADSTADDPTSYREGTLTGSEWRDNLHWPYFLNKLNSQENGWYSVAQGWGLIPAHRLAVTLKNGETPVKDARVILTDTAGKTLWEAVSDKDGYAYLFWNLSGTETTVTPAQIRAVAPDGTVAVAEAPTDSDAVTIQMEATNPGLSLDLMFVVDTTGSMSDELEYLKAELQGVVRAVAEQARVSVRTSVNFYRDIGDDYVVRSFPFSDNIADSVKRIQAQQAGGGGDYPEAVDAALEDAISNHTWGQSSVKLMFLVLDAPPHESEAAKNSIINSVTKAAAAGIRIIPIVCSGADSTCQVPFRTYAALTGGTYIFLTDDSGVGDSHTLPDVEEIKVEPLNQMLVRIICEYCE